MDNETLYEKFDWSGMDESHFKEKIDKIISLIPDDVQTILDIGCGNGAITNVLGQKYQVTGVDRSEQALIMVKTEKIKASADKIPVPDHSFDMVFSSEMLEHLEDEVLIGVVAEMKRISKKYIFITVPNDENPDKISVKCPHCAFVYNTSNHLQHFDANDFKRLFPEYNMIDEIVFGPQIRYYSKTILNFKKRLTPPSSWVPNYWVPKSKRNSFCPNCEHEFDFPYRLHPISTFLDVINVVVSPKKPYWLFIVMKKKD
jgi:SAM-dependent methyltransferase